jgi:recombination protein RecR
MQYPAPIQTLIAKLSRLPGIGKRSAERIALHLLQADVKVSNELAEAIGNARSQIRYCIRCGHYSVADICDICANVQRDQGIICVVERAQDILALEKSQGFKGVYHALGGKISPLNGIGPEQLRIAGLVQRIQTEKPREVVLALSADVDGDATALYLVNELKPLEVKVTRIAHGLTVGSTLEQSDEVTLARAIEGRREW